MNKKTLVFHFEIFKFITILMLIHSNPIIASTNCSELSIRHYYKNKLVHEKTPGCIVGEPYNGVMSANCWDKSCKGRQVESVSISKSSFFSEVGNPLFKVCKLSGGQPQIAEYLSPQDSKWHKFSRCLFDDGFVPIDMIPYKIK